MKINLIEKLFSSASKAQKQLSAMNSKEKAALEEKWSVEHAYYSSALEGSKVDRKEFDKLAKKSGV